MSATLEGQVALVTGGSRGIGLAICKRLLRRRVTVAAGYSRNAAGAAVPEEARERVISQIPVGRLGDPDEVARVVEFLAEPELRYITGQVYSVNGGLSM